jgi:hypothetical protein
VDAPGGDRPSRSPFNPALTLWYSNMNTGPSKSENSYEANTGLEKDFRSVRVTYITQWRWWCFCRPEILEVLIQAGGEMWLSAIHKVVNSPWNKEALPDQWKESIIIQVHKGGDKTDCNNYRGISLLSTSYKMLSNILLSRLNPCIDEIIGIIRRNRSTTDQIFCIRQILERKWEYSETVYQLFIDFKEAYDSVRKKVL